MNTVQVADGRLQKHLLSTNDLVSLIADDMTSTNFLCLSLHSFISCHRFETYIQFELTCVCLNCYGNHGLSW